MIFDRTIIITDPGYIAKSWGDDDSYEFNYMTNTINCSDFTNYIWTATGVGDGSWEVFSPKQNYMSQADMENYVQNFDNALINNSRFELEKFFRETTTLGRVCVDSGCIGVFYLDEVLKYNPTFLADYGKWCYTVVEDFYGLVDTFKPDHFTFIEGLGNKMFFVL